ncbi:zinc ribbon domain-containing protein, partial [Acinetobacter rudis]
GIREWQCHECGSSWDRDINSALNILLTKQCFSGHKRLAVGITPI